MVGPAYSPRFIDHVLRNWVRYRAAALDQRSPYPQDVTPQGLRHRQRNRVPDPYRTSVLVADVERAASQLPVGSLERRVVYARMAGHTFRSAATINRTPRQTLHRAYWRAVQLMAQALGYSEAG